MIALLLLAGGDVSLSEWLTFFFLWIVAPIVAIYLLIRFLRRKP
jgi:hypothetical protein